VSVGMPSCKQQTYRTLSNATLVCSLTSLVPMTEMSVFSIARLCGALGVLAGLVLVARVWICEYGRLCPGCRAAKEGKKGESRSQM
jgi:hypothetical protein